MRHMRKFGSALLALCLAAGLAAPARAAAAPAQTDAHTIALSSSRDATGGWTHSVTLDGKAVKEYDYTWRCDPSAAHDEVKNAPAEYYTGEKPSGDEAVYIARDILYYPQLDEGGFKKVSYDGEQEWAYYYTDGVNDKYIFATLPVQGGGLPKQMMHTPEEALENPVLHITRPGTYTLKGTWHGQIWVDLGSGAAADPEAVVTLVLAGADVTCTVAPAVVFRNVYECDGDWESRETQTAAVDTAAAGAKVTVADGTVNNIQGANVFRMLKTEYKKNQEGAAVPVQKKMRKTDGAFYSYMSLNVDGGEKGDGTLNITSGFEGLDSELHLTLNGGRVNIFSQDDGINVNEDGVSVVTFNGGEVHILAGLGAEGDGVDSNGFLVVNGGTLISMANPRSDAGLDSDCGSYVNGGTVVALGSTMDWAEADAASSSTQAVMNLQFSGEQSSDEAIIVTTPEGKVVFAYDPDKDEVAGANIRGYRGAIVSCPAFTVGGSFHVYVGGDVTGTETAGVYDPATVTGFSDAARRQCYSGTWEDMGRPGFPGGPAGQPPEGFDPGQPGGMTPPGGQFPGGPGGPDGVQPPEPPEGFGPGQGGPGAPDGQPPAPPEGFDPGQGGPGFPGGPGGESAQAPVTNLFALTGRVNNFSGVTDEDDAPAAPSGVKFTDVPDGAWYHDPAYWAVEMQITNGTNAAGTTFSPERTCTVSEILTFLYRAADALPPDIASPFTDVPDGAFYRDAALWAYDQGLVSGGAFGPDAPCTRAMVVTWLWKLAGSPAADGGGFTDVAAGSDAALAVAWAVKMQITNGTNAAGTTFSPDRTCTRGEIVTFLWRAYK